MDAGPDVVRRSQGPRPRLFYRAEYVCDVLEAGMRHTFDILRPQRIRDALVACGAARAEEFIVPAALGDDDLRLVHTPAYLELVRQPATLARLLFLDPEHPWDDRLLMPFLYASGGTLAAALAAAEDGGIGLNLGGGYHHAQRDKAEGFCPIADVAVAIRRLQRERPGLHACSSSTSTITTAMATPRSSRTTSRCSRSRCTPTTGAG